MDDEKDEYLDGRKKEKKPIEAESFKGKSSYDYYMHYHDMICHNFTEEYFRLRKTIEHGKVLLPVENKEAVMEGVLGLCDEACDVLKTEILKIPTQKVGWADPASKSFESITMTAEDGGTISCMPDQYMEAKEFFREVQYSSHIEKLSIVDSRIYYFLSKYNIVSKSKPFKDLIEDKLKAKYSNRGTGSNAALS